MAIIAKFSDLALGAKFRYIPSLGKKRVYVKISNDLSGGCIAEWDDNMVVAGWVSQGIYCLNNTGNDINVEVVI